MMILRFWEKWVNLEEIQNCFVQISKLHKLEIKYAAVFLIKQNLHF